MSASLKNHDGPGGNIVGQGIWAKIYNIQSQSWLTTSPFNVNQVSAGDQTESAIVALTGLKFLIAFYTVRGIIKTRIWTPNSSSNITTNTWTSGNEELVDSVSSGYQTNLKWLKMPKESKVLLTWDHRQPMNTNKVRGQFYDVYSGAQIGPGFILIDR
jgi:hypothetical protein